MNTKIPWQECFVDAERGLAFFDGITIEADSINDPRQDRVFPIFKKEQVFMCRQMLPLFEGWKTLAEKTDRQSGPPLALDVGTGSGVLAIFAAIHGCKVYALDISRRSIELARHNAQANHVPVFDFTTWEDFEEASRPGVWLPHVRFDEDFSTALRINSPAREEGPFDFIMLNPPYNPTFENVTPALHADGGEDGQEPFEQQIQLVPRLLRSGGHCAGHHMGVIGKGQKFPNVISLIEEAFRVTNQGLASDPADGPQERRLQYGAIGEYVKVLDSDRDVAGFLKAQYATYLLSEKYRSDVSRYIDRVAAKWALFTLLYFEFKKVETPAGEDSSVIMIDNTNCEIRPVLSKHSSARRWKWETREWVHRCIVEHATSAISIPWSSLFTDYVVSEQMLFATESKSANGGRLLDHSPMRLIDQWLAELPPFHQLEATPSTGAVDGAGDCWPSFDFVHVESVPFTPNAARLPGLRQEAALWLSPLVGGGVDGNGETFARHCFADWAACVKKAHESAFAPFLHAAFMGTVDLGLAETRAKTERAQEYRNWNPLLHSFLREGSPAYPPVRPDDKTALDQVYDSFDRQFGEERAELSHRVLASLQAPDRDDERSITLDGQSPYLSYYSTQGLGELKVADVEDYRRRCEGRLQRIGGVHDPDNWRIDLEYCHATLHGLVVQAFATTGHLPAPLKWSYLLSVPLDLSDPLYESDHGALPSTFRGSIFLFIGSFRAEWSPRQDRLVLDLARFATLLYNGRFNVEEARSQSFDVLESMGRSFSHELLAHKVAMRATHKKMSDVFRIGGEGTPVPLATDEAWPEPAALISAQSERVQTIASWLVCPMPRIYAGFEDTLSIWGSSLNWLKEKGLDGDMGFPEAVSRIVAIVGRAAFAEDWSKPLGSTRTFAGAVEKDEEFDRYLTRLMKALASVRYEGESGRLNWVGAKDATGARLTFLR